MELLGKELSAVAAHTNLVFGLAVVVAAARVKQGFLRQIHPAHLV
jgi:hypothetical protein